ncbi:hypothetical protein OUZ56_016592 [Daphnia magna]|uniref:Uncharacterized protein n=1 Tax=Daphnia magna TaxID=35525 RepID=A0ABR0AR44_9CRUS|nr:hypothetical protein OUZ56_016592 [Daphnia magna]
MQGHVLEDVQKILRLITVERRRELSPRPCPCLKEKVRTLIRTDSNATSTKYGHIIGGMTVCLVRDLESQVIAAS